MKKFYSILFALLAIVGTAKASDVVKAGQKYDITTTGNVDLEFDTEEAIPDGKSVVVFYYTADPSHPFLFGKNYQSCNYSNETGYVRMWCERAHNKNANGSEHLDIYGYVTTGEYWCYTICDNADVATVKSPLEEGGGNTGGGGDVPTIVPGQDIDNAIVLTKDVTADFASTNKTVYVKFTAANSGEVTINLSEETTRARWMEEGVMAYGSLRQNLFSNGNQFKVEKGHTYYCLYTFAADVTGTISYSLEVAQPGSARGEAILVEANGTHSLLGKAPVGSGSSLDYFYTTTWFRLEKEGALDGKTLLTVKIDGSNETEVALYKNDETFYTKSYTMGKEAGNLDSSVDFDIDLSANDYYIAISQDDADGSATFTFSVSTQGQTIATAIDAVAGSNTAAAGTKYYKYTHTGDAKWMKITGSVLSTLYNADGKVILDSNDFALGTEISEGAEVYFQATGNFTISLTEIPAGMIPSKPVIITNDDGASFSLNQGTSDTRRYMQYTAVADGTFFYGTDNAKVIETASSATVRDVTNPDTPKTISIVQHETDEFGETMFVYQWAVIAGHTYLIEQNLANNFGTVDFYTVFNEAAEGETFNKAVAIDLDKAIDLGRTVSTPKYYKFTAPEAGDYTVSVNLTGYVRSYDAEGFGTAIPKSYTDGLGYHNETFTLAAGETLVFSCEASEDILHEGGGVLDEFIPNYYATVTKATSTAGIDYHAPVAIAENAVTPLPLNNAWYGPVTVPAGKPLYVIAELSKATDTSALFFAVETATSGLQWVNKNAEISVSIDGTQQIYTLTAIDEERHVHILADGLVAAGTFSYNTASPTAIRTIRTSAADAPAYNILGQRISANAAKGIIIIGGKKVRK